jgi:hypothetical protein
MLDLTLIILSVIAFLAFVIWQSRRSSIVGIPGRNRHFHKLASELGFTVSGDDYFLQLEGKWKEVPVIIYPHNFEGPGSVILFYADSGLPLLNQTWVEPTMSLGRALVEFKNHKMINFDFAGDPILRNYSVVEALQRYKALYPYIAVTQPDRFVYSQFLHDALAACKNFIVLLVLDAGRRPSADEITTALDAVVDISAAVKSCGNRNNGTRQS